MSKPERCGMLFPFALWILVAVTPGVGAAATTYSPARIVVVGDSLSAGFQNFSLYDDSGGSLGPGGQKFGFAQLIAQQANSNLYLPLIAWPGLPPALGNPVNTAPGLREEQTLNKQTFNLSVPGYLLGDAISRTVDVTGLQNGTNTNGIDAMTVEVLGFPSLTTFPSSCGVLPLLLGGQVVFSSASCAAQLHPDTIIVSIGNNDALQALTLGTQPTNPVQFAAEYTALLTTLKATGARIVVGNLPDVTSVPFLIKTGTCVTKDNYVVPNLSNPPSNFADVCSNPAYYEVRSVQLVQQAQQAVVAYNQIISSTARMLGVAVADVNGLFRNLTASGVNVGGKHLTAEYGHGLFSLDGIHPTNTGYAILANAYISAMDSQLNANVASVDVGSVAASDPLLQNIPVSPVQAPTP